MPRTSTLRVFPTWRDRWALLKEMPKLLTLADAALQRRMAGNQEMPRWKPSDDAQTLALGIRALRAWAEDEPPADVAVRPEVARRIHAAVHLALRASAWPRWLLLERAFLDGSATGDLLLPR